jgi:hypothetical protein
VLRVLELVPAMLARLLSLSSVALKLFSSALAATIALSRLSASSVLVRSGNRRSSAA